MVSPEFWPEPGVRALEVGVHLHVVLEVLEHLRLEIDVPVLDYYHPLNMNRQYCVYELSRFVGFYMKRNLATKFATEKRNTFGIES